MSATKKAISTLAVIAVSVCTPALATPAFIPIADAVAGLADGQPWDMKAADGKSGRVRFDRDGTGRIESPVGIKIAWVAKGEEFCMKMGFMLGTRCFQAVRTANGFQGYTKGKPSITFSR
jgi:hypothetical protein